jgi:calcium binding protein 39
VLLLRFLDDVENLQLVMALLRSTSAKVQNRAYTVFKLFVQNPRRAEHVTSDLRRNREKLCKFLAGFQIEAANSDLEEEKHLVIDLIEGLN